ncbi:MAG: hypothetical protein ACRC7N_07570 [Clostridium sp.]
MYKEIIARNRAFSIVLMVLMVVIALYLEQAIDFTIYEKKQIRSPYDYVLMVITGLFVSYELFTFKVKYKYSYIANKLIVNRRIFSNEKNLVSIRKEDVVYIGKNRNAPKEIKANYLGKYTFDFNAHICIFNKGDKYYKFKFSPSEKLVKKLV